MGIDETKEVVIAAFDLAAFCKAEFKDGVQLMDAFDLARKFADPVFRKEFFDAINGATSISSEIKDLDSTEIIALGELCVDGVKKVIAA